jgi:hypothetical protein
MLDQNLLDKQFILDSLIDFLEKNTVNNSYNCHLNGANQPKIAHNISYESSIAKMILNTSKYILPGFCCLKT